MWIVHKWVCLAGRSQPSPVALCTTLIIDLASVATPNSIMLPVALSLLLASAGAVANASILGRAACNRDNCLRQVGNCCSLCANTSLIRRCRRWLLLHFQMALRAAQATARPSWPIP